MASDSVNSLPSKDLPTLCRLGVVGNLTDGQLLESFLAGNKETAEASFTALVDRHGPMVLRVCTQILGNVDDAQDAFQATFLVLVRRAGSVRKHDSVASWLYGIALRVARRARADAIRRQIHERRSAATAREQDMTPEVEPECSWPDLHDELGRLPEKYRESVVLCYLQGLSTQAAAQRLGCPQGTVLSRLSRRRTTAKAIDSPGTDTPRRASGRRTGHGNRNGRRSSRTRTRCDSGRRRVDSAQGGRLGSDFGHCRRTDSRSSQNHVLYQIMRGRRGHPHGYRSGHRLPELCSPRRLRVVPSQPRLQQSRRRRLNLPKI